MTPLHQKSIEHFTHPNHQLLETSNDNEYLCDGCKTLGTGKRFRCHDCDFDLHEYCGTCPMALSSFMHSQHQLNLVQRMSQATRQNERICDVCGDSIEGLFYRCKLCEFDVHPLCTQLPQQVRHVLDRAHPLKLQPFSSSCCSVCRNECTSWRYRCGICRVDIHLECLLTPCSSSDSGKSSTSRSRSIRQPAASPAAAAPPAFGAYNAYGVPSSSTSAYAYPYQAPSFGAYNYGYAVPFGFSPYNPMYHYQPQQQQQEAAGGGGGGRFRRKMFKIVGNIALGVFTNVVFGVCDF